MFMEVYYDHYAENWCDRYWEKEDESIPYLVLFSSNEEMQEFILKLEKQGYRCVSNNSVYLALLVNTDLRRCAVVTKACKQSCIDNRNYTLEEFEREVLQMEHYRIFIFSVQPPLRTLLCRNRCY